jgi:large subunit ribosomal protein L22
MPTVTAKLSEYRQSPRKVRLVAGLIRNKKADVALVELSTRARRSAPDLAKLLKSAIANGKAAGLDEKSLFVKEIRVDKGFILKRWMPKAHGRATRINKRTSNIMIVLEERKDAKKEEKPKAEKVKKTAPVKTAKKAAKKK